MRNKIIRWLENKISKLEEPKDREHPVMINSKLRMLTCDEKVELLNNYIIPDRFKKE